MSRTRKPPSLLSVLLVAVPVIIAVVTAMGVHYSQQQQIATAHLNALWMGTDGSVDPDKAAAVTPQMVQHLLDQGADVNGGAQDEKTPLLAFLSSSNMDVAKLLVEHGANVRERVHWGYRGWFVKYESTPGYTGELMTRSVYRVDVMQMLLDRGADVNIRNESGFTALDFAAEIGNFDTVKLLVNRGANVNGSGAFGPPLVYLVRSGKSDLVQLFLDHGANPNVKDDNGETQILYAEADGNATIVQLLLSHGADINAKNNAGRTGLEWISEAGNTEMVRLLLSHGADVNAKDSIGDTPLMEADNSEIARMLIAHGANVNTKDAKGRTALGFAKHRGNIGIIKLLKAAGAR